MPYLAHAALPAALLLVLAGCDSPAEQEREAERQAIEEGAVDPDTQELEAQAEALRSGDLEAREDAVEALEDRVEDVEDTAPQR